MEILYTNDVGTFFEQMLLQHIQRHDNVKVLDILKNVDLCNLSSSTGNTLLHFAADYGNEWLTEYLVYSGAAVDVQNRFKETPLMLAVDANRVDTVNLLLEANADPLLPDIGGQCALGKALNKESKIGKLMARALLDRISLDSLCKNIDYVRSKQFHSYCPLHHFIFLKNADITRILLESGSLVDARDDSTQETALHVAVRELDLENVKMLLKLNANTNAKRQDGKTPLACIPVRGDQTVDLSIVKMLMAAGATAFDYSSRKIMVKSLLKYGNKEIVRSLLEFQIDLKFMDIYGMTPLHYLALNKQIDVLGEVKDINLLINVRTSYGFSVLHVAARGARVANVKYLLEKGANVNAEDKFGKTPLHWVTHSLSRLKLYSEESLNCLVCMEMLLEHGAHPKLLVPAEIGTHEENERNRILLGKPVLSHLALMEATGHPIDQSIVGQINCFEAYKTTFDLEKQKLDAMKEVKIGKSVTLYDLVVASDDKISEYARHARIHSNLITRIMKTSFSDCYFHRRFERRFFKYLELVEAREKTMATISDAFIVICNVFVPVIAKNIVNYVDDQDLRRNYE